MPDSVPSTSASKPAPTERCEPAQEGAHFTIDSLGEGTLARKKTGQADDRILPFAVELGRAALTAGNSFAVSFIRSDGRQSKAGLALFDASATSGQVLDLATIHGDAPPPLVAADERGIVVVIADNDASGGMLRLAGLSASNDVVFGSELDLGVDESPAFDLALSEAHALVVWDEWDKSTNRSYITLNRVLRSALDQAGPPLRMSGIEVDAERPRMQLKKGGFWLSWIALGPLPQEESGSDGPLSVGNSWIELMPLHADGSSAGPPIAVSAKDGTVAGYDIAAGHMGTALITWRDAKTGPGISGGVIRIATVKADGSTEIEFVEDEDVGVGVPQFLFDPKPSPGAPHGWLALEGANGTTRFTGLSPWGKPLELLEPDQTVGIGSLLLAHQGRLLLARPKGQSSVLTLIRCGDGTPASQKRSVHLEDSGSGAD